MTDAEIERYTLDLINLSDAKSRFSQRAQEQIDQLSEATRIVLSALLGNEALDNIRNTLDELIDNMKARKLEKEAWYKEKEQRLQADFIASLEN